MALTHNRAKHLCEEWGKSESRHLFNYEVLSRTAEKLCCPADMIALRPVLGLLTPGNERLEVALKGEIEFWNQLDRLRLCVYERAVRPYMMAVKRDPRSSDPALHTQHSVRVENAERLLPVNPLRIRKGVTFDKPALGVTP